MAHDFNLRAPEGANKRRRIVGRGQGSGRGTTSGKGNKGQKARSGGKTYGGFEGGQMPLYRRLAQRGFSNYPFKKSFQIVNLTEIEKRYSDGETVDGASLYEKGLIKGKKKGDTFTPVSPVKILGNGDLTKKLIVKIGAGNGVGTSGGGITVSGSAKEKIQKAGGELAGVAEKSAAESSAQ
jgi:large subunit ribosomal protein L15